MLDSAIGFLCCSYMYTISFLSITVYLPFFTTLLYPKYVSHDLASKEGPAIFYVQLLWLYYIHVTFFVCFFLLYKNIHTQKKYTCSVIIIFCHMIFTCVIVTKVFRTSDLLGPFLLARSHVFVLIFTMY